jgi:16S rRNA processing protein RimM
VVSERLVPLGEIVTTHGLDGWLILNPFNSETTALSSRQVVFLQKDGICSAHELESSKQYKRQFLIKLRAATGIDVAKQWVGFTLCVKEEALNSLPPGQYYHYQVIGFEVFILSGECVGTVTRIWSTPGADIYVVQGETKEFLIPAVKDIVEKVDFAAGRLIINPPDGLLDL